MKKLISKCCNSEVAIGGEGTTHYFYCLKCGLACNTIEEPEEEVKEGAQGITNMEEIMTDMFGEGGKEEVKESFTPSDTFIEERMKKFLKRVIWDYHHNNLNDSEVDNKVIDYMFEGIPTDNKFFETYKEWLDSFLKSSLTIQRQSILEEIEKLEKEEDKFKQSGEEYKYNGAYNQALEDIKQIL